MNEKPSLQEKLSKEVDFFSASLKRRLSVHLAAMPERPKMTPEVETHIRNRVGPKSVQDYQSLERAISLVAVEAADLGHRISQYRYIERYREHFTPADAAMRIAFHTHIHVMRGNEIYIIMERSKAWLVFAYDLTAALDLAPSKMHSVLTTKFGKAFKRHLRERHKIVHAHERPSLISHVGSLTAADWDNPEYTEATRDIVQTILGMALKANQVKVDPTAPTNDTIEKLNEIRLAEVDRECEEMWTILLDCADNLIEADRLLPPRTRPTAP